MICSVEGGDVDVSAWEFIVYVFVCLCFHVGAWLSRSDVSGTFINME